MGNKYCNITLFGAGHEQVIQHLNEINRPAFVSPTINGWTFIYDKNSDSIDDPSMLELLASSLSEHLHCTALAIVDSDDTSLWYTLWNTGKFLDEYDSTAIYHPESTHFRPYGGDAEKLGKAFNVPDRAARLETILRTQHTADVYLFEMDRHQDLMKALGCPDEMAESAYYLLDYYDFESFTPLGVDQALFQQIGVGNG